MSALLVIFVLAFYFLPAIVAYSRGHKQATPIYLTNLFFGWTVIGWMIALIWASAAIDKRTDRETA